MKKGIKMTKNIMINGFGRIGRTFLRTLLLDDKAKKELTVVAINVGPCDVRNCDVLFKYDSIMPEYPAEVAFADGYLTINNQPIKILTEADPCKLPHAAMNVTWVVEASGRFTSKEKAGMHLQAGAKKVLITAPSSDTDITIIPGVNAQKYQPASHHIISLGSCTTNAFAPLVKILKDHFGLINGLMTTTHAYTNDQVLLDVEHKDPRRARAAALNIIPTKTGADKVIVQLFPELEGKIKALAVRVPVPLSSLIDFAFTATKPMSVEAINTAMKYAADHDLKHIVQYIDKPLVSSDFIGNPHSCIVDSLLTQCVGAMGKVFAWYDNEYGYSMRVKDFLLSVAAV
jgi:glyceraldehyde-3-phosphate dehydrogenase type I